MNIAYFLLPKSRVAFLYDDYSVRQGLEKMKYHGYSAIPVITREEYLEEATQNFLDRNYGGSCARMLTMLSGGERPDEKEIEALRQMLEEWEKK